MDSKDCKISREFLIRLKLNDRPAWQIAKAAAVHPSTLSQIISGMSPLKEDDPRVLRVAAELGLNKEEAFA